MSAPKQWRSLDALADTPEFRGFLEREFPAVGDMPAGPERRRFLKLMAASFALAGLAGCDQTEDGRDWEVAYVRKPERMPYAEPMSYASATMMDGFANGVLIQTVNGRPLKVEGNPEHPWSRGGTDVLGQASILELYDPARSESVRRLDQVSSWTAFRGATHGVFAKLRSEGGQGLRLLTGPVTSPLLLAQIEAMREAYPQMRWHSYAPVDRTATYTATRRAFGRRLETRHRFGAARVIVALDGDFLDAGPQQVGAAKDWVTARRASIAEGRLLSMHAAGPIPNLTLAKADYPVTASQAELRALAEGLLADVSGGAAPAQAGASGLEAWRARAAAALREARGAGLVVVGLSQPAEVHEAAHRINAALENVGKTVFYTEPAVADAEGLGPLVDALHAGQVQTLLTIGANPVYDGAAFGFAGALSKAALKIHAGLYRDETGLRADWHVPLAHPLESWGDARALDGAVTLMQPTIEPLYTGRPASELVAMLTHGEERKAEDMLRRLHQGALSDAAFEADWHAMLRDGFIKDSAFEPVTTTLTAAQPAAASPKVEGLEILLRPDPSVWDGAGSNNPWLQELPKPLTKLVWDNMISVGPKLAAREGLQQGDIVFVEAADRRIEGAVWILPGQADGTVGLTLGYGRQTPDRIAFNLGYDAYKMRTPESAWAVQGGKLVKTGRTRAFVTTQNHSTMEGHDFVRTQQLGGARAGDDAAYSQATFYAPKADDGRAWGMVIDLDACIGCNACVTSCQAENNIAVVGPEEVAKGREMHWLRVDRYYEGPPEAPTTHFQPVPCMHCENAPCEVGCPVEATLHDVEGLNLMVYNRCIGTRACAGYCPYKVRHFNFKDYSGKASSQRSMQYNPEVTVRARGVMEKCTYCVQRIAYARIQSNKQAGQPIADGAVQTACQNACPTQAISFGDLNDKASQVREARHDPRNYALLGELNVRPRTTYLAKMADKAVG